MKKTKQKKLTYDTQEAAERLQNSISNQKKNMEEQYVIWFDRIKDPRASLHAQNCQNIPLNEKMITSCLLNDRKTRHFQTWMISY